MNDIKDHILSLINDKIKQKDTPLRETLYSFIEKINRIGMRCNNYDKYKSELDKECSILLFKMKKIDRNINLELIWSDRKTNKWSEMSLKGLKIIWSKNCIAKEYGFSKEYYIDISDYLFE